MISKQVGLLKVIRHWLSKCVKCTKGRSNNKCNVSKCSYSLAKEDYPGLELNFDGEIVGTVSAFGEGIYKSIWKKGRSNKVNDIDRYNNLYYKAVSDHTSTNIFTNDTALWVEFQFTQTGLTVFDKETFLLDSAETSIDREYKFTVAAEDQYKYSIVKREFVLKVLDPEITKYSNLQSS